MSESKVIVFDPINFEEQQKNQPGSLNYETKVWEKKNGNKIFTNEETGFIFHQYSQLAPKEIKTIDKVIKYKPSQRNYIKFPIFEDQNACLELEEQINHYDNALAENREILFGKFNGLFTHVLSVKEPKEEDELDTSTKKEKKIRYKSCKLRLEMGWNYYYDDVLLDSANSAIVKNAFFDARKQKKDTANIMVKLNFTDVDGNTNVKEVRFGDIIQEKDKILTTIIYRRPESIPQDAKPVTECTEKELIKFYGKGEPVEINTADDLDKYYRNGCYISLVYEPLKVYAQRNKDAQSGKRQCSYIFQLKLIDIINDKPKSLSYSSNKQYENYVFKRRNGGEAEGEGEGEGEVEIEGGVEVKTEAKTIQTKVSKSNQVLIEKETEETDEIDGEEQEQDDEQDDEDDEEVVTVVETKPVTKPVAKTQSNIVQESKNSSAKVIRKTK